MMATAPTTKRVLRVHVRTPRIQPGSQRQTWTPSCFSTRLVSCGRDWSPSRRRCLFGRKATRCAQGVIVRRIVRDCIAAAIDRTKPQFEQFIAGYLECPDAVPLAFSDPLVSIREIRRLKVTPRFRTDYPEVDVVVSMHVSVTARTRRRDADLGTRTFLLDVQVDAAGSVAGRG